ncbi:MAG: urocanate reductase [Dehalococcoidia bacterium]|nr:MAG: urocanate reductase [Dehalococcoidia bacterium]
MMPWQAADLVIIGAGTAGLPLAIEAADRAGNGRVLVIEKRHDVGGMLHISGGQFSGAGTRRQRERGIVDNAEAHYADVERIAHGRITHELLAIAVREQGPMVDWLESLGFDFHPETPALVYGHEVYSTPRTYWGSANGLSLVRLFKRELQRRIETGTVRVVLGLRLTDIVMENGAVAGVIVQPVAERDEPAGPPERIATPRVVLATGGFGAAPDLLERFLPPDERDVLAACLDHATGDGLRIAERLGASIVGYRGFLPATGLLPDPDRPGFTLPWPDCRLMLQRQRRLPYEIWLNRAGRRFIAEDTPSPEERERALLAQPDRWMAVIWDQRIMETADPIFDSDAHDWTRERILAEAERGHFIYRADSLEGLARLLGLEPSTVVESVARFNRAVAAGRDEEFNRTALPLPITVPPFYGVVSRAGVFLTREGLRVDTDLRVLDVAGRPIPGLYAVGEVIGAAQFMGDSYASGMSVGPCIALGRRLGRMLGNEIARLQPTQDRS